MNTTIWLMAANIAVWIGLGMYLSILLGQQKTLAKRLQHLEESHRD